MYEKQVKLLRYCAEADCTECAVAGCPGPRELLKKAADAIEELSREYESIAASLNESVELVRKLQSPCWIPVTDYTPKYSGYYLVCGNEDDVYTAYFGNTTKNWWTEKVVTHWMPLPPLPEQTKEE